MKGFLQLPYAQDRRRLKKSSRNNFHLYHMLDHNTRIKAVSSGEKEKKNKKKTYLKLLFYIINHGKNLF